MPGSTRFSAIVAKKIIFNRIPKGCGYGYGYASCEVRTHASFDSRVEHGLKSTALDHSAKLAI